MITPDDAMRQAHMTPLISHSTGLRRVSSAADLYAYEGSKAFEKIFGFLPEDEPQAAAIFIGQYMRTAAHDYDVAMRERGK